MTQGRITTAFKEREKCSGREDLEERERDRQTNKERKTETFDFDTRE